MGNRANCVYLLGPATGILGQKKNRARGDDENYAMFYGDNILCDAHIAYRYAHNNITTLNFLEDNPSQRRSPSPPPTGAVERKP